LKGEELKERRQKTEGGRDLKGRSPWVVAKAPNEKVVWKSRKRRKVKRRTMDSRENLGEMLEIWMIATGPRTVGIEVRGGVREHEWRKMPAGVS